MMYNNDDPNAFVGFTSINLLDAIRKETGEDMHKLEVVLCHGTEAS